MGAPGDKHIVAGRAAEQDAAVIPQDPPPLLLRSVGWLLLIIFATVIVVSIVVPIPETVECRYILVPENGADPIQSPLLAVVDQVLVEQGQEVKKDDMLFVLRSDEIRGWQTDLQTLKADRVAKQESMALLERSYASELEIRDTEIQRYEGEVGHRERELQTRRTMLAKIEELKEQKIVSDMEMMEQNLKMAEIENDLSLILKSLDQVRLARQRIKNEHLRRLGEEDAELRTNQVRIDALKDQLDNSDGVARLTVRAPYDGVVIDLKQRTAGNVVRPAEELCQLARLEGEPRARLFLGEADLALIVLDQPVRLFFDAFPYQRYGTITGKLVWISPAAVSTGGGAQFVGQVKLDETTITIADTPRELKVGMTGRARIQVGSRLLAESLIEPLRRLREETRQ